MPDPNEYNTESDWMTACVPKMVSEGKPQDQAVAACTNIWQMKGDAVKYRMSFVAVKAVGDYRLDVTVLPFTKDSDGQWADTNTDVMEHAFSTPLVIYQHGIKQGARELAGKPLIIGDSVPGSLNKQVDGWHILVDLRSKLQEAADIMKAAWKGLVAVSSDSISHLARLEVGGKLIMYEKSRPGRIAVWPLAGFSLWEMGNGNFNPANRQAIALPAMKAMYREAGIPFPEIEAAVNTKGVLAEAKQARKRAEIISVSKKLLKAFDKANGDK